MKEENINKNLFKELYDINVTDKVEQKNGLNYLSWAYAWAEVKKRDEHANYEIERFGENNSPYLYDDKLGYMVFTNMTIFDEKHMMWLPVMDAANKAMLDHSYTYEVNVYDYNKETKKREIVGKETKKVEPATMFDINKTLMRCLVKNIAMFGLGLSLYTGEDLPEQQITTKEDAEKYILTFGKYKGKTLAEILKADKKYIEWLFWNEKTDQVIKDCITLMTGIRKPTEEEQKEILNLMAEINKLAIEKKVDFDEIRDNYDVKSSKEMSLEQLRDCVKWLKEIAE